MGRMAEVSPGVPWHRSPDRRWFMAAVAGAILLAVILIQILTTRPEGPPKREAPPAASPDQRAGSGPAPPGRPIG